MNKRQEFLQRPEVQAAVKGLTGSCFEQIEAEDRPELPDPAEFLRGKGIALPATASLKLNHSVHADGIEPEWFDCGEGVKSRPECKLINGKLHCVWVCP